MAVTKQEFLARELMTKSRSPTEHGANCARRTVYDATGVPAAPAGSAATHTVKLHKCKDHVEAPAPAAHVARLVFTAVQVLLATPDRTWSHRAARRRLALNGGRDGAERDARAKRAAASSQYQQGCSSSRSRDHSPSFDAASSNAVPPRTVRRFRSVLPGHQCPSWRPRPRTRLAGTPRLQALRPPTCRCRSRRS